MKKSDQMKAQLNALVAESKNLMNKEGVTADEITAKSNEIDALKAKIVMQEKIEAQEMGSFDNSMKTTGTEVTAAAAETNFEADYKNAFMNALTGKNLSADQRELLIKNAMSSTTGADGGYLIPIDQQVQVRELMREFRSLRELANVENVNTLTGSRNIEKDAEFTAFVNISEGDTIPDTDSPQFVNIAYSIKDYAGILPVPNNLLNDTKALEAYLMKWLAKKAVATENALIVAALNTLAKTAIDDVDDVKDALNVTLDPAIADKAVIVMNQDSFNKFDKMKDNENRPLLQPDPTNPTRKLLAGKPVMVYSNKTIKTRNDGGTLKAPVIIGSIKEALTLFDRQAISILSTNVGAGAFEKNQTKFRPIIRLDLQKVDTAALVFGEIVVG